MLVDISDIRKDLNEIECFVLLAGAYNLGFFIELAEYFIFYFLFYKRKDAKQNFLYMYRNEKQ